MLTRREVLLGAAAAAAMTRIPSVFAKASQPTTRVNFDVPAGACDCHTHIHAPEFPFYSGRVYTPEPAMPDEMAAMHKALHVQRVVIVTPSVYGTDNRPTLLGIKARGNDARGVAVIDDKTSDSELDSLQKAGFRGIRLNLATTGVNDPNVARKQFQAAADRMKSRNWHVQLNTSLAVIAAIKDSLAASAVPIVFDHFGGAEPEKGPGQAGFRRSRRVGAVRKGLREDFGDRRTALGLFRLRTAGESADRGQRRPHRVGNQLAASEFDDCAGTQADRPYATVAGR